MSFLSYFFKPKKLDEKYWIKIGKNRFGPAYFYKGQVAGFRIYIDFTTIRYPFDFPNGEANKSFVSATIGTLMTNKLEVAGVQTYIFDDSEQSLFGIKFTVMEKILEDDWQLIEGDERMRYIHLKLYEVISNINLLIESGLFKGHRACPFSSKDINIAIK